MRQMRFSSRDQTIPSFIRPASLIMFWFRGGSQTSWTSASSTPSMLRILLCASCATAGPMPQPGAVKVIFTSTLVPPSGFLSDEPFGWDSISFNHPLIEGIIARMTNDEEKARSAFIAAHAEQENTVRNRPNDGPAICMLGLIDAGLGRKEEALHEGR